MAASMMCVLVETVQTRPAGQAALVGARRAMDAVGSSAVLIAESQLKPQAPATRWNGDFGCARWRLAARYRPHWNELRNRAPLRW